MSSKSSNPIKILFFSMDGAGHLNACVGMAQALAKRGHEVKFLLNEAYSGQYVKYGFEEILLKRYPNGAPVEKANAKNPFKGVAEQLLKAGMLKSEVKTPLQKLKERDSTPPGFMFEMTDALAAYDPQIGEALQMEKPDAVIVDHFFIPPVFNRSGIPWMYLSSGNPLNLYQSEKLPPFGSGYATDSDPETWVEYRDLAKSKMGTVFGSFQKRLNDALNYTPPPEEAELQKGVGFSGKSKVLNIYGYPEELDYQDIVPIPDKFARVDAFCLESPDVFKLPEEFVVSPGDKLVYVSMGSMGSVDVGLMKRVTEVLGKSPHKFIVSKGPHAEKYELPPNCWGEAFLPQTRILPLVDLVITHGGNNTITETFSFGKPMIIMPMFGDQYDNAQRVQEKKYGLRMETYGFTDEELLGAIDRLLADKEMIQRAKNAAERVRKSNSKEVVAKKIEQVVADLKKNRH